MGQLADILIHALKPLIPIGRHWSAGSYPTGWYRVRHSNFDPRINRHTGKPHQHAREIARRQRQEARRG